MVKEIIRKLLGCPPKSIDREKAILMARAECEERQWLWQEPIHVREGVKKMYVRTNARCRGQNVAVVIDLFDGRVLMVTRSPR
jgi:hypothetical protein